jgi:hypothetical protein
MGKMQKMKRGTGKNIPCGNYKRWKREVQAKSHNTIPAKMEGGRG